MTTLVLVPDSSPFRFISLGVKNHHTNGFDESTDFPIGTEYTLTAGKFPLTDYKDLFNESKSYHTLNGNIEVKIIGFTTFCQKGQIGKYGSCTITVEKEPTGGRKNKSNRRKSNRRKSNRRR